VILLLLYATGALTRCWHFRPVELEYPDHIGQLSGLLMQRSGRRRCLFDQRRAWPISLAPVSTLRTESSISSVISLAAPAERCARVRHGHPSH
jgi:hypothetical protein